MSSSKLPYDVVVVGSGFSGAILARQAAEQMGRRVLVVEKRDHICGNMFDFTDEFGIRIQKYGPHTFHTNIQKVYDYLLQFCELQEYHLKCEVQMDGVLTPSPFNFKTIEQFYPAGQAERLKGKLLERYGPNQATVLELLDSEDKDIREYAEFLFAKDYSQYTAKQWGKRPDEIDPSVLRRVPVIFNYRDTYFNDKYEGVPEGGFSALFTRMLDHPGITVQTGVDALEHIGLEGDRALYDGMDVPIVYTGAIDELFGYRFGKLPYRSLWFDYQYYDKTEYQPVAIVAYPGNVSYTRITEYTKLPEQQVEGKTVVAVEYPLAYDKNADKGNEPYYPILTEESQKQYGTYKEYAARYDNLILCGRLADFRYYNMDLVIERALAVFEDKKDLL